MLINPTLIWTIMITSALILFSACVSGSSENEIESFSENIAESAESKVIASQATKLKTEQEQVYSKMSELVSVNACQTSADCALIPVGNMACGGPASYMAYSTGIGSERISALKNLAERSKELDTKLNALSQMMGACVFHSAPGLVCENNMCATKYEKTSPNNLIQTDIE